MKTTQDIRIDFENIRNEIAQLQLSKEQDFQLALAILEEYGKYNRGNEAARARTNGNNSNNSKPISQKQKEYLQDLGVNEMPATSREASALIEQINSKKSGQSPPLASLIQNDRIHY